ncbi:MAG: hypothetical protein K5872_13430 [Rhizobiaceae bacterium]|nr:hypothetical protein [Rhizobiaceae bacterium]MCV0407222.1 hypothetical protein [Rhizobiaceae bacterium]
MTKPLASTPSTAQLRMNDEQWSSMLSAAATFWFNVKIDQKAIRCSARSVKGLQLRFVCEMVYLAAERLIEMEREDPNAVAEQ